MQRKIFIIWLLMLVCLACRAQNSIDRMVERYSTLGGSHFVTAVKRNPQTRKVEKVVKRLTVSTLQAGRFVDRFKNEAAKQKDVVTTTADGYTTMILTVEGATQNRIYTLRYLTPGHKRRIVTDEATITIIINMKD